MASDMEHFVPIPKRLLDDILAISREFQAIYTFFPANAKEIFNRFKAKLNEINGEFRVLSGPRLGLVSRWTVKLNFIVILFFRPVSRRPNTPTSDGDRRTRSVFVDFYSP